MPQFEKNRLTFISGQYRIEPDLYVPINYASFGINGVRKTGEVVTASFPLMTDSDWRTGKWGSVTSGSVLLVTDDIYCISVVSGTDFLNTSGTLIINWCPFYNSNVVTNPPSFFRFLAEVTDHFSLVFAGSTEQFGFARFSGSGYVTTWSNSYSFVSGTWINVAFVWNNQVGMKLFINGVLHSEDTNTWQPGVMGSMDGVSLAMGCRSGTGAAKAHGLIDDVQLYTKPLQPDDIYKIYLENHDTH